MSQFIRKAAAELEDAFRTNGQRIPGGLTGEQFVSLILEDLRKDNEKWAPEFERLSREARAELPSDASGQDYFALFWTKIERWVETHRG